MQLRALERDAKSQRELLESYLAKYREATAREHPQFGAGRCARHFARHAFRTCRPIRRSCRRVLIATLATLMLCGRLRADHGELLAPSSRAAGRPLRSRDLTPTPVPSAAPLSSQRQPSDAGTGPRRQALGRAAPGGEGAAHRVGAPAARYAEIGRRPAQRASAARANRVSSAPPPASQHRGPPSRSPVRWQARARRAGRPGELETRRSGASADPSGTAGLSELAAGTASFGDIITKDKRSSLRHHRFGVARPRHTLGLHPACPRISRPWQQATLTSSPMAACSEGRTWRRLRR